MEVLNKKTIGKDVIEEYYWNGKVVVYVNGHKSNLTFERACAIAEKLEE